MNPRKWFALSAALILGLLLFSSCGKSRVAWVFYDETRCADRWDYSINNEKLKENFTTYFASKGVKIYEVEIFNDRTAETCGECTCKTGRRFKCKIKKGEVRDLKGEGFYQ